eukprot:CAMPEP_0202973656 /NCGR_PEP_ID=MMETSP1396-20130829/52542_1 /ASSEMBLY_ACC=CAM_ASM_000872 /TAXON_ID= /ORGANISM="Pseudokeronopsis sp., Strain Brazil" /LENGTH=37 /DNA_ID= /DNA_START= /DNA_END= /DNA_ORIENTATION=
MTFDFEDRRPSGGKIPSVSTFEHPEVDPYSLFTMMNT